MNECVKYKFDVGEMCFLKPNFEQLIRESTDYKTGNDKQVSMLESLIVWCKPLLNKKLLIEERNSYVNGKAKYYTVSLGLDKVCFEEKLLTDRIEVFAIAK